jgi:hypothetical protein
MLNSTQAEAQIEAIASFDIEPTVIQGVPCYQWQCKLPQDLFEDWAISIDCIIRSRSDLNGMWMHPQRILYSSSLLDIWDLRRSTDGLLLGEHIEQQYRHPWIIEDDKGLLNFLGDRYLLLATPDFFTKDLERLPVAISFE